MTNDRFSLGSDTKFVGNDMSVKRYVLVNMIFVLWTITYPVFAQDDLAKQSQNPIGNIISLPFQNDTYFDVGPSEKITNVLSIKPVYPIQVGNFNLINRGIIPIIYQEGQSSKVVRLVDDNSDVGGLRLFPGTDSEFGLGNIQYQGYFSPAAPGKVIWGVGPTIEIPTNTDSSLGSDTWSAGPGVVVLTTPGNWLVGMLASNIWSFAKDGDEEDVNLFAFQYFANYNLHDGWYLTSGPVITANWEADSGEEWTVPIGGGVGKLVRFGNQPVDFKAAYYNNVESPRFGSDWSLQLQVKFLFPKK